MSDAEEWRGRRGITPRIVEKAPRSTEEFEIIIVQGWRGIHQNSILGRDIEVNQNNLRDYFG
ncbi:MAG: hypothetical protein AAGA77_20575 [Bacteroidota bacterium]